MPSRDSNAILEILAPISEQILRAPTDDLRRKLVLALESSLKIDRDHDPPQPFSPQRIAEDFGVPITVQRQYSICLTKDGAFKLMNQLNIALTRHKVRRQFTKQMYETLFHRPISSAGKKPYVFTHAEVLHMQELAITIPMPEELASLLK
jgi:hypothetical protein